MTKEKIIEETIEWFENNVSESAPDELIQDICRCLSIAIHKAKEEIIKELEAYEL